MRTTIPLTFCACLILLLPGARSQDAPKSLAEAARKEAERRQSLEAQGVEAKVIAMSGPASVQSGKVVTSRPVPQRPRVETQDSGAAAGRLHSVRNGLDRLDRQIREATDRLGVLRSRAETARKENAVRLRRPSAREGRTAEDRLRTEIQLLEAKLLRLREERLRTYDAGRRAGFLPGELDGKGAVP
jgi:hypothetical protein